MKRIALFLLTNVAVVALLGIVASLLGVNRFLTPNGLDLGNLLGFALVIGFGGAIISLLISKPMAKRSAGVRIINDPQSPDEAWIVDTVRKFATEAKIGMPEVGIFEGAPNAFATGAFKNSSLVAVSTGLLEGMTREEVEAVIGHEIAHVANGDMVTMTLVQGVINAFVMFLARVIAFAVSQQVKEESRRSIQFMVTILLEIVFSLLGMLVVAGFSRWREFRADAGGGRLAGREKMIAALQALQRNVAAVDNRQAAIATLKISGRRGFLALLSTHPPLEERIERLRQASL